ncbi:MAG: bifunctional phosphoglucose/phosphomannose isomerase, partial [Thermoproteus sp.]|nr:bifunctional phosphoglucose/phosphomannose isomerase [Thermoproteus sp.]
PEEHKRRVEATLDLLGGDLYSIDMTVAGVLTFLKHVGIATVEMAMARGIDPLKTPRIDELKRRIA